MEYDIFDIKFKIDHVKEFLRLKNEGPYSVGYGSYAKSIKVKKSTFISWVKKYQENKFNYYETSYDDKSLMVVGSANNDFINLCEDRFEVVGTGDNIDATNTALIDKSSVLNKNMSLKINGGVIEFDPSNLKKVIEVLKSC